MLEDFVIFLWPSQNTWSLLLSYKKTCNWVRTMYLVGILSYPYIFEQSSEWTFLKVHILMNKKWAFWAHQRMPLSQNARLTCWLFLIFDYKNHFLNSKHRKFLKRRTLITQCRLLGPRKYCIERKDYTSKGIMTAAGMCFAVSCCLYYLVRRV